MSALLYPLLLSSMAYPPVFHDDDPFYRRLMKSFWHDMDAWDRRMMRYWKELDAVSSHSFGSTFGEIENTKDKFALAVDVKAFKPEEVKVELVGRELTITGKHEERKEKGDKDGESSISRAFVRKYLLPEDVNLESLKSTLNKDGKLKIEAPKMAIEGTQPKNIPIEHTS